MEPFEVGIEIEGVITFEYVPTISTETDSRIDLDVLDVNESASNYQRMISVSDQTKTPTFEYSDFVVADFDVEEFVEELDQRPDIKAALGLTMVDEDDY